MLIKLTHSVDLEDVPQKVYQILLNVRSLTEQLDELTAAAINSLETDADKSVEYLNLAHDLSERLTIFLDDSSEILKGYCEIVNSRSQEGET
jgi:hypothetical protein